MDDLAQFLRDRLNETEQRARGGYYSDTHWERFTTEAHLHAWKAWREHFPREQWDVKTSDAISEAARDGIRERITAHEVDRTEQTLREIDADRALLAEYSRLLDSHAAHQRESARLAEAGDDADVFQLNALRREADYLPAMLHVLERWAKRKAVAYDDHPDYRQEWRP
ncbi:DUF6221 family protein [Streptomyces sp. SID161]|uniref:DUF6221 family protein n=1 Tax=Streptomyces sp. SID161 TaxID=2690251 RepID=UPI0013719FC2|nr:DUF6221 family protein [Streptomyces sp. SID161]MYW49608.1 hypothetical protein [Streptomyces sp. SID161]